jgi:gamma-glutamyltranspeptidase/glutathione hydrolase
LLTATDLLTYQVRQCSPIRIAYRGYEVLLPPPSSVGGILIAFSLKLLAHFKVKQLAHGSSSHLRLLYEVMQATTLARRYWDTISQEMVADEAIAEFLGDKLVEKYYNQVQKGLNEKQALITPPEPKGPSNTSHISIIDSDGMAVSLTTTAGESAGYVVPQTGYIPNNMLGEEDLHPHGFHTRAAGERIPTMMSPTIVLKDGEPRLVVGSGGSIRLRTAILQVLSNLLDYDMTLDDAVEASRVHIEKGALQCEGGYNYNAVTELEAMGYPVNRWQKRSLYFGGVHSVARTEEGQLVAIGDNRREGVTAVV